MHGVDGLRELCTARFVDALSGHRILSTGCPACVYPDVITSVICSLNTASSDLSIPRLVDTFPGAELLITHFLFPLGVGKNSINRYFGIEKLFQLTGFCIDEPHGLAGRKMRR